VVTLLDSQGEVESMDPSTGGFVPIFRITATVLDPEATRRFPSHLPTPPSAARWGEDLALEPGPPSAWSLVPPPLGVLDWIAIQ
jgi:hypothetical protein